MSKAVTTKAATFLVARSACHVLLHPTCYDSSQNALANVLRVGARYGLTVSSLHPELTKRVKDHFGNSGEGDGEKTKKDKKTDKASKASKASKDIEEESEARATSSKLGKKDKRNKKDKEKTKSAKKAKKEFCTCFVSELCVFCFRFLGIFMKSHCIIITVSHIIYR